MWEICACSVLFVGGWEVFPFSGLLNTSITRVWIGPVSDLVTNIIVLHTNSSQIEPRCVANSNHSKCIKPLYRISGRSLHRRSHQLHHSLPMSPYEGILSIVWSILHYSLESRSNGRALPTEQRGTFRHHTTTGEWGRLAQLLRTRSLPSLRWNCTLILGESNFRVDRLTIYNHIKTNCLSTKVQES